MDTVLSPPVGLLLGGRYHVGSQLARGGMATVYLGTDTRLDRVVALKIAHPELSDDAEFVRRFIGEARSAARLSSPNVVAIFDQGSDKRLHYIAMEYVPGRTLRELLNERGRLNVRESLDIMAGVLAGLEAAHSAGFAHRDVKPENVLLTSAGAVKVADFGLARAVSGAVQTKGGMIIGTAAYLAPEQVSGGTSDARTDVYASGVMLFELLTGVQPHTADSPLEVAYKHVNVPVPPPSNLVHGLSGSVDALVAMATSRNPDLRPADAGQFLRAITEVREGRALGGTAPYAGPASGPHSAPYPAPPAGHGSAPYAMPASYPGPPGYAGPPGSSGPIDYSSPPGYQDHLDYSGPPGYQDHVDYSGPVGYPGPQQYQGMADYQSAPYADGPYGQNPANGDSSRYHGGGYDSHPYQIPEQPPHANSGATGASAMPSLGPQSSVLGQPGGPGDGMNHTLVVAEGADFGDYGQAGFGGPGGQDTAHGANGGRGRRPESWLARSLFSRRFLVLAGGLAVVLVIALVTWWMTAGRYEAVPSLRGIVSTTARGELHNLGLTAKFGKAAHNPLPKGEVIMSTPPSGRKVASGGSVTMIVSLGPELIQVPNVTGQPLATAEAGLRQVHLRAGTIRHAVSSTVPPGDVISTTPRAYAKCPKNQRVTLTISAGPGLPNFKGMQVADAQTAAASGGYTINPVADAKGSQPANTIVSQSPPPNTPITPGEVVTVHYSPGPPGVPVPNVAGMNLPDAISALEQAGFQVKVNQQGPGNRVGSFSPSGTQPQGTVITVNVGIFSGL